MLESQKSILRAVILGIIGFLIGVFGISIYYGTSWLKNSWGNFFSFTAGNKIETSQIAMACTLDQKSEAEQIFFISCGGIY